VSSIVIPSSDGWFWNVLTSSKPKENCDRYGDDISENKFRTGK
jgi:hypothetical protein